MSQSFKCITPVLILLYGGSGVGKDTVWEKLRQRTKIHRIPRITNRAARPGETPDATKCISSHQFSHELRCGNFVGLVQTNGFSYALHKQDLAIANRHQVVACVGVKLFRDTTHHTFSPTQTSPFRPNQLSAGSFFIPKIYVIKDIICGTNKRQIIHFRN